MPINKTSHFALFRLFFTFYRLILVSPNQSARYLLQFDTKHRYRSLLHVKVSNLHVYSS